MDKDLTALDHTPENANPGASDGAVIIVALLDDHIRYTRQVLKGWAQVEHDLVTGQHKFPRGGTAGRPINPAPGTIYFNTDTNIIEIWDGAIWQTGTQSFPAGTVLLFRNGAAPTGWTRVVDVAKTDSIILIRSNGEALADGGSWAVAGFNADAHVLVAGEIPSHNHGLGASVGGPLYTGSFQVGAQPGVFMDNPGSGTAYLSGNTGGGGGHVHTVSNDSTWRPKHMDVIAASKN